MIKVDPQRLLKGGLAIWVTMDGVASGGPATWSSMRVGAIVDTGAECSGISSKLHKAFAGAIVGSREIYTPTFGRRSEPTVRCEMTYEDAASTTVTADFSLIPELEPWDVLIGRDLLMNTKLVIDFPKGEWSMSLSSSEVDEPSSPLEKEPK